MQFPILTKLDYPRLREAERIRLYEAEMRGEKPMLGSYAYAIVNPQPPRADEDEVGG